MRGGRYIPATPNSHPPTLASFNLATGLQLQQAPGTAQHPGIRKTPAKSIEATGALALRSRVANSWKGLQRSSTTPPFLLREDRPREGTSFLIPWTNQWQSQGAPQTAQASVSVQRQFHCRSGLSRYTVPPELLDFARPYFCQLSAVTAATNLMEGRVANVGSVPLHFPPLISSQLLLPSLYTVTPYTGSTLP